MAPARVSTLERRDGSGTQRHPMDRIVRQIHPEGRQREGTAERRLSAFLTQRQATGRATSVAWNLLSNFALLISTAEALRSVLRSLTDFTALKSFVWHKSVSSASSQCDYCRNELGRHPHLYWRMRFCSLACMSAYQQRLSPQTRQKILRLDHPYQRTGT